MTRKQEIGLFTSSSRLMLPKKYSGSAMGRHWLLENLWGGAMMWRWQMDGFARILKIVFDNEALKKSVSEIDEAGPQWHAV